MTGKTMIRLGMSTLLAVVLGGCYVPRYYHVTLPADVVAQLPDALLDGAQTLVVLPCWEWLRYSRLGFGPPVVIAADAVEDLPDKVAGWRGFEVVDYLGHEGSRAPVSCGLLIAADNARIFRGEYTFRLRRTPEDRGGWVWRNRRLARIGPGFRADLLRALSSEELAKEGKVRLFGDPYAEVLGAPEALSEARRVVEQLHPGGDDVWVPLAEEEAHGEAEPGEH